MPSAIPLSVAALIAVGIIVIGCFYLVSPERISGSFGLKPPASDADTRAWLRPKGIRDVASGLVVLPLLHANLRLHADLSSSCTVDLGPLRPTVLFAIPMLIKNRPAPERHPSQSSPHKVQPAPVHSHCCNYQTRH